MIKQLESLLRYNASDWGLELRADDSVRPVIRANPGRDRAVRELGGRQLVVFWFRQNDVKPFVVSKLLGPLLQKSSILECIDIQRQVNSSVGYPLFPTVVGIGSLGESHVVFMEPLDGPDFDIELARAIVGPERSCAALERAVLRQFRELGDALRRFRDLPLGVPTPWGNQASLYAAQFLNLCPQAGRYVSGRQVSDMVRLVDSFTFAPQFVFTEDHVANYLAGLRAVDQIAPAYNALCHEWPGPICGLRILIAYFRASPIQEAYRNFLWPDALAACVTDVNTNDFLHVAVRRFLQDIGLGTCSPDRLWALLMAVFFLRGRQELEFHADDESGAASLRTSFSHFARRFVAIQEMLGRDQRMEPRSEDLVRPQLDRERLDREFAGRSQPGFGSPLDPTHYDTSALLKRRIGEALSGYPIVLGAARFLYRLPKSIARTMSGRRSGSGPHS